MQEHTTITPHLTCRDAMAAIEFYKKAFGAEAPIVMTAPDGKLMHGSLSIDGAAVMIAEEWPEYGSVGPEALGGTPVKIHLQVPDCDAVFARAVEAGCSASMPPEDMFWGDRYAMVKDPFGHVWTIATTLRPMDMAEVERALAGMAATA